MSAGRDVIELSASQAETIINRYVADGKLTLIPAKRANKLVVLEWIARRFEVDRRYREVDVNRIIRDVHPDAATLRRGLYDEFSSTACMIRRLSRMQNF